MRAINVADAPYDPTWKVLLLTIIIIATPIFGMYAAIFIIPIGIYLSGYIEAILEMIKEKLGVWAYIIPAVLLLMGGALVWIFLRYGWWLR